MLSRLVNLSEYCLFYLWGKHKKGTIANQLNYSGHLSPSEIASKPATTYPIKMDDYLLRIIAQESGFRALVLLTTQITREACRRQRTTAAAMPVLADGMTAAAMLGSLLKMKQRVALRFEGDGPVGLMITESSSHGLVRGYMAHPEAEPTTEGSDRVSLMGKKGILKVVKDIGLKKLIEGVVERQGTAAEDLTHFLNTSEQTHSFVSIATVPTENGMVQISGGILIQALPGHREGIIEKLRNRLQELPPFGDLLLQEEKANPDTVLEKIADIVFEGTDSQTLEKKWLFFHCGCSRERSEDALITLGKTDLLALLQEHEEVVTDCHFCNEKYVFTHDNIRELIEKIE
jgi:molecular chaperone Hsp33